ncbi:XP_029639213.1uncharacterized protein LOC115214231 [Octopus vulgaris]|nr:uncharacterized protein LOC115214231 [Octopus sinensis]CAI9725157.1 XP_029639213.1uncharacterized protein LOC115214231 [Octopus vulgaris]
MGNLIKKISPPSASYEVILPPYQKPWQLLFSGDNHSWDSVASSYGFQNSRRYCCRDVDCDGSVCSRYVRILFQKGTKNLEIRYKSLKILISCSNKSELAAFVNDDYEISSVALSCRDHLILLILHRQQGIVNQFAFPIVDIQQKKTLGIMLSPKENMTIVNGDITPDCSRTAILFFSFSEVSKTSSYDLYIYSHETFQVLNIITLNHAVQPYVAFDPRFRWSRIAVANYECRATGVCNELVTYSLSEMGIVVRSNLCLPVLFGSSRFHLSYSKDGTLLIVQKLTDNRFGVTAFSDIYLFNADTITLLKYLTSCLPGLIRICRVNYQLAFSRCGSYMRVLDHKQSSDEVSILVYQMPRILNLQSQCRIVILQHLSRTCDVDILPLPSVLRQYLKFQPIFR